LPQAVDSHIYNCDSFLPSCLRTERIHSGGLEKGRPARIEKKSNENYENTFPKKSGELKLKQVK